MTDAGTLQYVRLDERTFPIQQAGSREVARASYASGGTGSLYQGGETLSVGDQTRHQIEQLRSGRAISDPMIEGQT